jgi:hypothetical protein
LKFRIDSSIVDPGKRIHDENKKQSLKKAGRKELSDERNNERKKEGNENNSRSERRELVEGIIKGSHPKRENGVR